MTTANHSYTSERNMIDHNFGYPYSPNFAFAYLQVLTRQNVHTKSNIPKLLTSRQDI